MVGCGRLLVGTSPVKLKFRALVLLVRCASRLLIVSFSVFGCLGFFRVVPVLRGLNIENPAMQHICITSVSQSVGSRRLPPAGSILMTSSSSP